MKRILLIIGLVLLIGTASALDAEITSFSNNYTSDSDIMFNCTQTTIKFNITVADTSNVTWWVDKVNQTSDAGSLTFNYTISDTDLHEIRAETNNGTSTDVVEWVITNKSLSSAPGVFDFFSDGKYETRSDTDPWGRVLPEWTKRLGTVSLQNKTISTSASYNNLETNSTIIYGTWKYQFKFHDSNENYNDVIGFYPIMNNSWDGSDYTQKSYRLLKAADEHFWLDYLNDSSARYVINYKVPSQTGSNFYKISDIGTTWHNVTLIHEQDGKWQVWLDDKYVPYSNRKVDEEELSITIGIQINAPTAGMTIEFDNVEVYEDKIVLPVIPATYSNGNIIVSGDANTLTSIHSDIGDIDIFDYNPATNIAVSTANITMAKGAVLDIVDEILYINTSSTYAYFRTYSGITLNVDNSTVSTNKSRLYITDVTSETINGYSISETYGDIVISDSLIEKVTEFRYNEARSINISDTTLSLSTATIGCAFNPSTYLDVHNIKNITVVGGGSSAGYQWSSYIYDSDLSTISGIVPRGYNGFINTIVSTSDMTEYWAQARDFRYYLDVLVEDSNGNPITGTTVSVNNTVTQSYPAQHLNPFTHTWTLSGSNWYQAYNSKTLTSTVTSLDGHTPRPNESDSIVITDYVMYNNTDGLDTIWHYYNCSYSINITDTSDYYVGLPSTVSTSGGVIHGDLGSVVISNENLNSTWLRSVPNTYQNTTIITSYVPLTSFNVVVT